jgi:hypothetical protein
LTTDLIQFAYVAGEIAPSFHGRSDLEKYDLALDTAENFFVDYRGGISTRPGLEFIDYVMDDDKPVKFFNFKFSPDIEDTYGILAGDEYFRFIQDGGYVLETGQSITSISLAATAVLAKNSHGYSNGDWVKIYNVGGMVDIEGQTFVVTNRTANTFQLFFPTGQALDSTALTAFTSGTMARIYTVTSPYDANDLEMLQAHQIRDLVRFTHKDYEIYNLVRIGHANWTLTAEDFDNPVSRPTSVAINPSASGNWGTGYVITAVDFEGNESFASNMGIENATENPAINNVSLHIDWNGSSGVDYFNVYRSNFFHQPSSVVSKGVETGYIGRAYGTHFRDNGIIPDFSRQPPRDTNPFINGAIERINVTVDGSGYSNSSTISITDAGGTGFVGQVIIETQAGATTGDLAGILIIERGSGYVGPSSTTISVGSGADVTYEISPLTGNNPACGAVFQQRQIYGATENKPLTIFGSRPGRLSNFSSSEIVTDGDPYEHTLDAESMAPIRHLVPAQGGCLVFNADGIWLLTADTGVVTPLNAQADPKSFGGSSILSPLKVDADLLYIESKENTARMLSYNDAVQTRFYLGRDVSVLSNHMISAAAPITAWAYAPDPFKLAVATREDGQALAFTVLKEQEIYAWTRYKTQGLFEAVCCIQEGRNDRFYYVVKRYINGRWTKFLERQATREFDHLESAFCVDCGLTNAPTYPAATLQLAAATGSGVVATASAAVFASGDVGKVIRAGAGKATVTAFTDSTHVTVSISSERPFETIPETTQPLLFASGDWSMDTPVTALYGLYHLEGETLAILADGNVVENLVVEDGRVTLPQAASRINVGLGYTCRLKSLPITMSQEIIDDRRKRVPELAIRFKDSRDVKAGSQSFDRLYPFKERTTEPYGEPTRARTGIYNLSVEPQWSVDGRLYVEQSYPLPATILGWVPKVEIGDDPD